MNAHGISVFYGATDQALALAEVRPPVGSWVATGCFALIRPVQLLDVEALRSVYVDGSFFDPGYTYRLERAKFLKGLSDRITRPVMPNDESIDYLVTQAIADYLATKCNLDGIIYPSVQANNGRMNVVLFHKAALVEPLDFPKGTKLNAQIYQADEDGYEVDCYVWEEVPAPEPAPAVTPNLWDVSCSSGVNLSEFSDVDDRKPTLRLDSTSVKIHKVRGMSIDVESHSVTRRRFEKHDPKF